MILSVLDLTEILRQLRFINFLGHVTEFHQSKLVWSRSCKYFSFSNIGRERTS